MTGRGKEAERLLRREIDFSPLFRERTLYDRRGI